MFLFVLGVAYTNLFVCASWAQKWQFLEVLAKKVQNYWITINPLTYFIGNQQKNPNKMGVVLGQNLGQIRSDVIKKGKKLALSVGFSHILLGEYILKHELVVV